MAGIHIILFDLVFIKINGMTKPRRKNMI
jgi:hypothetical protein